MRQVEQIAVIASDYTTERLLELACLLLTKAAESSDNSHWSDGPLLSIIQAKVEQNAKLREVST